MATKMTREEAINTVRNIYQTDKEKEALATLIPELAESEDERIRKRLIEYFEGFRMGNAEVKWEGLNVQEVLVWLEKQKERNLIMANSPQLKEQKQEKFPPYVTGFKGHPDPAGTSDLEEAAEKYIQGSICDLDDGPTVGLAKESFIAGAEWQKEQKPAEWSEEDEEILKLLILNIGRYMYFGGMSSERILSFLKSLRPQPHWKPSEEQMKALNKTINILAASPFLHQNDYLFNILNGLREELKKLL